MIIETALSAFWLITGLTVGVVITRDFREMLLEIEREKKRIITEEHNKLLIENKKLEALYDLSTGNRVRRAG